MQTLRRWIFLVVVFSVSHICFAEEFFGPFPSWSNVQTDYGAIGDGKADDTKALQKALIDLAAKKGNRSTLYFPSGTYRITRTLDMPRHPENGEVQGDWGAGTCIFGEDPNKTVLLWDGTTDTVMFNYNSWYVAIGRLTFDGKNRVKNGIAYGAGFVTGNELSDLVFKDMEFGIRTGVRDGIAEHAVLRCKFYRCSKAGISLDNWNSLDWWIRDCYFEDCYLGVTNEYATGNFHVYTSIFKRSKKADISIRHTCYFSILKNYSEGSQAFFLAQRAPNWTPTETYGSQTTIQANTVVDPEDTACIRLENSGNFLVLDNTIISKPGVTMGPIVLYDCPDTGDIVAIGNTFTAEKPFSIKERMTAFGNKSVERSSIHVEVPPVTPTPARFMGSVLEVPQQASAQTIQRIIDTAAAMKDKSPVIHFSNGTYELEHGLVVPANTKIRLVGDGYLYNAMITLSGKSNGPAILLKGPSHATISNLQISGGVNSIGIAIDNCDEQGGFIYSNQLVVGSENLSEVVYGLQKTGVQMDNHGHDGIAVIGTYQNISRGTSTAGVNIFQGATARFNGILVPGMYVVRNGGKLLCRDIWYEGDPTPLFRFENSGEFTYASGLYAPCYQTTIVVDNFKGKALLSQLSYSMPYFKMDVQGNAERGTVMLLGVTLGNLQVTGNKTGFTTLACRQNRTDGMGTLPLPNRGDIDSAGVSTMLAQLRTSLPLHPPATYLTGTTNVRMNRVRSSGKMLGMLITSGNLDNQIKPPENLTPTSPTSYSIHLSWKNSTSDVFGYSIERKPADHKEWSTIGVVGCGTESFDDVRLVANTHYMYRVSAINHKGKAVGRVMGATTRSPSPSGVKLNCAGPAVKDFIGESYANGGRIDCSTNKPIDRTKATNPAPEEVYQTAHKNPPFQYALPGQVSNGACTVRLHMAEITTAKPGEQKFNVLINGAEVLNNFDVLSEVEPFTALIKEFPVKADSMGVVTVQITGNGKICGIEIMGSVK